MNNTLFVHRTFSKYGAEPFLKLNIAQENDRKTIPKICFFHQFDLRNFFLKEQGACELWSDSRQVFAMKLGYLLMQRAVRLFCEWFSRLTFIAAASLSRQAKLSFMALDFNFFYRRWVNSTWIGQNVWANPNETEVDKFSRR